MRPSSTARRRLLAGLVAALVLSSIAYLVVRSSSDDGDAVATAEAPSSSTAEPTTSVDRPETTTTAIPTTAPPSSTAPLDTTTAPPTTAPPTSAPSPTAAPAPPFLSSIHAVSAEELGASWTPGLGCTPPEALRRIHLTHWGYDGAVRAGDLIVEAAQAERVVQAFADVYAARFPIQQVVPVSAFGGDDGASMRANNTSGYNCRTVAGGTSLSQHAYGRAVDINPLHNPYVKGGTVDPPEGARWADRGLDDLGMIRSGDAVVQAFERIGWGWGGYWSSGQDYQHLSATGR